MGLLNHRKVMPRILDRK